MKKAKSISLIALLAAIVGLIGAIICLVPGQTKADKVIAQYVSAINSGKTEKMSKYTYSLSDLASEFAGEEYAGLVGALEEYSEEENVENKDKIYGALTSSVFNANSKLPSDITKVKSVKLVGCVDGEEITELDITGISVNVILKIDYVDAKGKNQTTYSSETIELIKVENKYYIIG